MSRRCKIAWVGTLLLLFMLSWHSSCEYMNSPAWQEPDEIVPDAPSTMLASWYCPGFSGRPTANGEYYDCSAHTAAHRTLPFGTRLLVRNPQNNVYVVVRVNDRGPYAGTRELDLSEHAANTLGIREQGIVKVEVWRLP